MQHIIVGDLEYATFVKAGSIIPVLNVGKDRMSITQAINDNIRIEVYPTSAGAASGMLYIDDYTSHQYTSGSYSLVNYSYDGTIVSVTKAVEAAGYYKASNKIINEIVVMNVDATPQYVLNRWVNNTPYPAQGNVMLDFVWLPDTKELHLFGLAIPVEDGLVYNQPQELIEIVWFPAAPATESHKWQHEEL